MYNNRSFVFYPQISKSTKAERFGGWTMLPLFPSKHLHNCSERSFLPQVRHTHTHRLTSHAPVLYVVIASGRPQRLGAANEDRGPCQTWTNMANIFCLQAEHWRRNYRPHLGCGNSAHLARDTTEFSGRRRSTSKLLFGISSLESPVQNWDYWPQL